MQMPGHLKRFIALSKRYDLERNRGVDFRLIRESREQQPQPRRARVYKDEYGYLQTVRR